MAIQIIEGFDIYGAGQYDSGDLTLPGANNMLDGAWAEVNTYGASIVAPSFGARSGQYCLNVARKLSPGFDTQNRVVLTTARAEVFVNVALYFVTLPIYANHAHVCRLMDGANNLLYVVTLEPDGSLAFRGPDGAYDGGSIIYQTGALAISTGAWNTLQVRFKANAATGAIEIKVNDEVVMTHTGINTGSTNVGQVGFVMISGFDAEVNDFYIDDLVINDTTGTYNTSWLGEVRVATLRPKADDETGWTPRRREKYGTGVALNTAEDGSGLTCSDSSDFELGSGDFTMEGLFNFLSTPTGSKKMSLFSKWRASTNERSYELFLDNTGDLVFRVSTDGTTGTVSEIFRTPFEPTYGHYQHIVIQRASGVASLFVDGVKMAAPTADANSYHDNASLFSVGGLQNGATSLLNDSSFVGLAEEIRITKGVARYATSGFVPPSAAFPRSVVAGDADFASVSLLLGFNSGIIDESGHARAVTARGSMARFNIDDAAPGAYKVVNQTTPRDDTFVEAPYIQARGILTATANFGNNETVVVDGNTYTFKTVFVDVAGNVLIGATLSDSIDNLAAAINNDAGEGTVYGTGTAFSTNASAFNIDNGQMLVEADTAGTAGNSVGTTETCANADWNGETTLVGGLDIPGPSSFSMNRLPSGTTGVRGMALVQRTNKSDSGPAKTQLAFVTADDSSANGAEQAVTTAFTYYQDIIEEDPATVGALTPSSFIGSRVRIDRTE